MFMLNKLKSLDACRYYLNPTSGKFLLCKTKSYCKVASNIAVLSSLQHKIMINFTFYIKNINYIKNKKATEKEILLRKTISTKRI